jgi:hypothetical protein
MIKGNNFPNFETTEVIIFFLAIKNPSLVDLFTYSKVADLEYTISQFLFF